MTFNGWTVGKIQSLPTVTLIKRLKELRDARVAVAAEIEFITSYIAMRDRKGTK